LRRVINPLGLEYDTCYAMTISAEGQSASARRHDRKIGFLLLLIVFLIDLALMPRTVWPSDAAVWRREAATFLTTGSLRIDLSQVSATERGARGQYYDLNLVDGHVYSKYGIVNSILVLPPMIWEWAVKGKMPSPDDPNLLILNGYSILITLLLAWALYIVTARYSPDPWRRAGYVLACLFATYLWYYQRAQESDIIHALLFVVAFECLMRALQRPNPPSARWLLLAWGPIGLLVLARAFYLILIPWLIGVVIAARWRHSLRLLPVLLLPPAVIVAILGGINHLKFGSPFLSGYHQWWPDEHVPTTDWMDGVYGLLFSCHWSIFLYFPLLLAAIPGLRRFAGRHPLDAWAIYSLLGLTLILLGSIVRWRGEWTYGPRYLIFLLPLAALPALEFFNMAGAASLRVAVMLLAVCAAMQFEVIRSEWWLFYRVEDPLERHMGREVEQCLYDRHEALLYFDLYSHELKLDDMVLFKRIQRNHDLTPLEFNRYKQTVQRALAQTNLYWWPPG
jgi:hypothetical protein